MRTRAPMTAPTMVGVLDLAFNDDAVDTEEVSEGVGISSVETDDSEVVVGTASASLHSSISGCE